MDYSLSIPAPERRLVQVELDVAVEPAAREVELAFPVWTPGSYLIREHQRHVNDLRAFAPDGRACEVEKLDKRSFRIATGANARVRVTFEAYAHELTVRTSHVEASHAFLNPVSFCPVVPGRESEPCRLRVRELPAGWDVACALPRSADGWFEAPDYDALIDSPLECGAHAADSERLRFSVRGVDHELVVWGRCPVPRERLEADLRRIVEAQAEFFGGLPYPRYLFLLLLTDKGRGGLEHRDSAALLAERGALRQPRGYEDFLGLVSHELFHAWNVKRIRPAAFVPYRLGTENHTRLLWAFEGLTSYYEDVILLRAGLLTRARYLEIVGERLTQLARTEGRRRQSVEEASFDAWVRLYRPDEETPNSTVSYYLKGSLIGLLLDLELRRRTGGSRSLDDVLRLLWERYGRSGTGVPEDGVERACEEIAGQPLTGLFDVAVRGTDELPLEEPLRAHGLRLLRRAAAGADDKGGRGATGKLLGCDVGAALESQGGRLRVASVRRGSPADLAGLTPGDEVVALDGVRASPDEAFSRLHDRAPGSAARLTVFRRDELLEVEIIAGPPREDVVQLLEDPEAAEPAKALLQAWLGPA